MSYLAHDKCIEYNCIFHFNGVIQSVLGQMHEIAAPKVEGQKNSNLKDSLWLLRISVSD
jgi:hypothetical protein